ncbi:electron transfer flavoprotein subunit beta/FixA family protein [Halobacillus sp. Marseille-Q1614]|uniref:electron transfer flavoprotein subunit beta/FixA family protein n=1 Tax=Halobacillus sp. Marseille-Q1614 TaxID=2709134 RepID=UPI00156DA0B1|nr:electron transfer flavoprotein subunit beta/FixA family protein [Halobacillus sp. Marseille-Q1614]
MELFVLMKRTFDTEEKVMIIDGRINKENAEYIINPYDDYAIEEAVQLRDQHGGEVTIITVGGDEADKELRTALAMGADKAVWINTEEDLEDGDAFTTAQILAHYFKSVDADMILAGNVAIDEGSGQVGPRLAELVGIPAFPTITRLDIEGRKATIERDIEGDVEVIEASLPFLVTTQQGLNEPRYPSLPGIMKAKKKPLEELELDDLEIEEEDVYPKTKTLDVYLPPEKQAGRVLEGETNDQVRELISLLHQEAKVI